MGQRKSARRKPHRNAEIRERHLTRSPDQHVLGFDIAVDHALLMHVLERGSKLQTDGDHLVDWQWPAASEIRSQGLTLNILQHHERLRRTGQELLQTCAVQACENVNLGAIAFVSDKIAGYGQT